MDVSPCKHVCEFGKICDLTLIYIQVVDDIASIQNSSSYFDGTVYIF